MPAFPEIGYIAGDVREAEVQGQLVSEKQGDPNGHAGIAGKITVNLHREGEEGQKTGEPGERGVIGKDIIDKGRYPVSDKGLQK